MMNITIKIEWGKTQFRREPQGGVTPPWPIGGGMTPPLRIRP
jgi:hypothetical protein